MRASRQAWDLAHAWASATSDLALTAKIELQLRQRVEQCVATLTSNYSGVPELLEGAMDYQYTSRLEDSAAKARVAAIRTQASKLGDDASARNRLGFAAEHYDVAGDDAKANAARERQKKLAMDKMQPSIDQMRKQGEQIQKEFSDPAKVQAMREQALAMQKSLQQQKQVNAAGCK